MLCIWWICCVILFFFSSRRRHTRYIGDWSSDVCSSDLPSPRHDRLGSRIVNLTRLQASRDVAARVLAFSVETLDTPLEPRDSRPTLGVCYSALRRLPRRDLHSLEEGSVER